MGQALTLRGAASQGAFILKPRDNRTGKLDEIKTVAERVRYVGDAAYSRVLMSRSSEAPKAISCATI
jgi:hypothetical protein